MTRNAIRETLRKKKRTQQWLAERAKMSQGRVSTIIKAQDPKISTVLRICKALGMKVEELYRLDNDAA